MSSPLRSIAALLALLTLATGCAPTRAVGARAPYAKATIRAVAVAPAFARASFGAPPDVRDQWVMLQQEATITWLQRAGVEVLDPRAFTQQLTERGAWQDYQDGILLRAALSALFERDGASLPIEAATLRALHARGALDDQPILFTELVYHSDARCRERADQVIDHAQVNVASDAPDTLPRHCVVSHTHAKLIAPAAGETMWFNTGLIELHLAKPASAQDHARAIARAVAVALGGEFGLKLAG